MNPLIIVDHCYDHLPNTMKEKPWEVTDHGRKILQTEDELNAYIAAYGEMHVIKCRTALQNFPFEALEMYPYEIFDWGCGQGLATLSLLDMLRERGKLSRLERIHLIEPSQCALERAIKWVGQSAGPGIQVIPSNTCIPNDVDAAMPEVSCSSRISINLFSNILDIRNLSLQWLSRKVSSLAYTNYLVCVGPYFTKKTNTRIADFCGYFKPTEYFSNINSFPFSYTTRTHHAYGCETKCFVHQRLTPLDSLYQECAGPELDIDPYDYSIDSLKGIVDDQAFAFYRKLLQATQSLYDVFFRPAINCDTVDYVLTSKNHGIILINICQNLDDIDLEYKRLSAIKDNLFSVHLKNIKIDSITNSSVFSCVKTALYFPNHTLSEVNDKIKDINFEKNAKLKKIEDANSEKEDYFKYLYRFTYSCDLKYVLAKITPRGYKADYYDELVNLITSNWHTYLDGDLNFRLSERQKELVRIKNNRLRVKGVAGCGKTQVVANRAVEQLLKTGDRVLIITYNISLIQYIRMRISQVPADFSPNMFEIINYHQFFKSKANQYSSGRIQLSDYDKPDFFEPYREKINRYKSIIIDEVQDFKESWIQSIITYFLSDNGSVSLFGDGEQNIYDREQESSTKMPPIRECGFLGSWREMNDRVSMRILNPLIASLNSKFAHSFLGATSSLNTQNDLLFEDYYIKYWNIDPMTTADTLVSNILWIMSEYHLEEKDVTVLGQSINLLRDVESSYVKATNHTTMINFETASQYHEVKKEKCPTFIQKDLDEIRRTAKTHFTTNCDCIKMSTIHSFKGWESKTILLLLQPEMHINDNYDGYWIQGRENMPALVYTALTRAKCNLFILNLGNQVYHNFFSKNID